MADATALWALFASSFLAATLLPGGLRGGAGLCSRRIGYRPGRAAGRSDPGQHPLRADELGHRALAGLALSWARAAAGGGYRRPWHAVSAVGCCSLPGCPSSAILCAWPLAGPGFRSRPPPLTWGFGKGLRYGLILLPFVCGVL